MSADSPTKEGLLAVLKRKKLTNLINDLNEGITTFEEMMSLTEAQWKEFYGLNGLFIYNYLHPAAQLIASSVDVGLVDMDVEMPSFQPSNYSLEFPFFEIKDSHHFDILGRDDVIRRINNIVHKRHMDKYRPIIISTSRGMGKTFLLKKFGMQQIEDNLKTDIIGRAMTSGRILSFDFARHPNAIQSDSDVYTFFPRLMVYFLCRIFGGTRVDGINFERTEFDLVSHGSGRNSNFNRWLRQVATYRIERMIEEYIRLTNIAFGIEDSTPPVFLLDEIQKLCCPSNVISSFSRDGTSQMHSQLSLLLTQLAGKFQPVCICTGTNSGNIISITEKSVMLPQVLSLTPLVSEYREFWKQRTEYLNQSCSKYPDINMDSDEVLIDALVYASYQIPRLLDIAHSVWFDLRKKGTTNNCEFYIQEFEKEAIIYYGEMVQILRELSTESIVHILLACGVHWIVNDEESNVPGTQIPWVDLIQKSLVFPYLDGCYIFPFSLVWRVATFPDTFNKKKEIETRCSELIQNLDVNDLYKSYDLICSCDNYNLGVGFETLFASSLAVKYYLRSISTISTGNNGYFNFTCIYDIDRSDLPAFDIMNKYEVNFSHGISRPTSELFTDVNDLGFAIVHNINIHNAHHDIILPARTNSGIVTIAVQAKASFDLSGRSTIERQLQVSPTSLNKVQQLFWLYLGEEQREKMFDEVLFLDGSGCCNGLALDFLILVKKLRSENQKFSSKS